MLLLHQLESGRDEPREQVKRDVTLVYDLPLAEVARINELHSIIVIRNPYSRVLSAFLDKFRADSFRTAYGRFELSPVGFCKFLYWLKSGGISRNLHWDLQSKMILLPLARYDCVLRFESFPTKLPEVLSRLGVSPCDLPRVDYNPLDQDKRTAADQQLQQFYSDETLDLVRNLYARDFAELGYSTKDPWDSPIPN